MKFCMAMNQHAARQQNNPIPECLSIAVSVMTVGVSDLFTHSLNSLTIIILHYRVVNLVMSLCMPI